MFDYDAELRLHNERFRAAAGVRPADQVLDIGCGAGQSTRDAARAAVDGHAVGVDVSAESLATARRVSDEEGLRNVTYQQADAQVHAFPPERFDVCISRFGTMFFADPVAAFTNIGHGLRPGARLVLLVWQHRDRNESSYAVRTALAPDAPAPTASEQEAFSLGDPAVTETILVAAGFEQVDFAEVHEPVYYGRDSAAAYDMVLLLREPKGAARRPGRDDGRSRDPAAARRPGRTRHRGRRPLRLPRLDHHRPQTVDAPTYRPITLLWYDR